MPACVCAACVLVPVQELATGTRGMSWKDRRVEAEIREKGGIPWPGSNFETAGTAGLPPKVRSLDGVVCVLLLRGA